MRNQDRTTFSLAAQKFDAWILVRRTNLDSLDYIGCPGYIPKPIECKPKTADLDLAGPSGRLKLAGLVVSPELHIQAFRRGKDAQARALWRPFAKKHGLNPDSLMGSSMGYQVDQDRRSQHYGCLMLDGKYIHGDYDLYDIILTKHPRGNLAVIETLRGVKHMRGPRFIPIMSFINHRIGVPMIQHGGEMQFGDHSEQSVDVFGPNEEQFTLLNQLTIVTWYEKAFEGRRPLGANDIEPSLA